MAAEGDFDVFDDCVGWEVEDVGQVDAGLEFDVVYRAGRLVVEMAVFVKVRAIARGLPVEINLADDVVADEGFEAVVNRGEGDVWQSLLDFDEDFVGGRVSPFSHEKTVDFLALAGHAEAVDFLRDIRWFGWWLLACHRRKKLE